MNNYKSTKTNTKYEPQDNSKFYQSLSCKSCGSSVGVFIDGGVVCAICPEYQAGSMQENG